ncbi:MAG: histone deacetylase [Candidatus Aminicenantes bacterium]|jgi:acetoin utilization deacetylase AcuC-like enzyme
MARLRNFVRFFQREPFPFKFIYSEEYWKLELKNHVFPVEKYRLIYEKLLSMGARKEDFLLPRPATEEDILLVHTPKYTKKLKSGKLSLTEVLNLELPYTAELFGFALLYVGGTIVASEQALKDGLAVHIGGGFHHAFADHGEGFCVLNDVAVAVEKMKKEKKIERAMIVDVDVHQGNGTAAIFLKKDYVFTFSIHQMDLYPAEKPHSSLDVGLWTGDGDEKYLSALRSHFPRLYQEFQPDLIVYVAGADPFEKDQLGGLNLTLEGLKERGEIVIGEARKSKIPVVVLLAGGYAHDVRDTVSVHINTVKTARKMQRRYS